MSVEQSMECLMETEVLGENLPQCRFGHHKSHMIWPGLESEPPQWEASLAAWAVARRRKTFTGIEAFMAMKIRAWSSG
jgi:hypothetical protein